MAAKHLGTTEIEAPEGGASSSDEYIVHHRIQGKKVDTSYISEFERLGDHAMNIASCAREEPLHAHPVQ